VLELNGTSPDSRRYLFLMKDSFGISSKLFSLGIPFVITSPLELKQREGRMLQKSRSKNYLK
jgi:hypothetical protein